MMMMTFRNAMTEVASALAMAFFSLVFLTMAPIFLELIWKSTVIAGSVLRGHHRSLTTRK